MINLKGVAFSAINNLDINFLKKHSPVNVLVPFHHLVSDEPVNYIEPLYKFKSIARFEKDLDYLLKNFTPITLTDLINCTKNGKAVPKNSFLVTFDDALKQVYEIAMPILIKKGVPAALFIVPAFLDNTLLFYDLKKGLILNTLLKRPIKKSTLQAAALIIGKKEISLTELIVFVKGINYLSQGLTVQLGELLEIDFDEFLHYEKPFMSSSQVRNFISNGFHIGAHSMDHPLYSLISTREQVLQTITSINWVADRFDLSYKAFSFPHVDTGINQSFFNAVLNNNKGEGADMLLGNRTGMMEKDQRVIHRFIGENPAISIEKMCKAVLAYSGLNRLTGMEYVNRR